MVREMFLLFLKCSVIRSERMNAYLGRCVHLGKHMSETQAVEEILVDEPMPTPDMFYMPRYPTV